MIHCIFLVLYHIISATI